nr:hypothetical protein [Tanacetum cinerariifolium]
MRLNKTSPSATMAGGRELSPPRLSKPLKLLLVGVDIGWVGSGRVTGGVVVDGCWVLIAFMNSAKYRSASILFFSIVSCSKARCAAASELIAAWSFLYCSRFASTSAIFIIVNQQFLTGGRIKALIPI